MTVEPTTTLPREKIAILGGAIGSLAAAWHLSNQPAWQERYQITVYQQGWRLGGKGASGRNAQCAQRIEEHGLHIRFGFYSNAFALIRAAYDSLGRAPGTPLATWRDAFRQHDYVALADLVDGDWRHWHALFPTLPGEPGSGPPVTLWQMALTLLDWIGRWLGELGGLAAAPDELARSADQLARRARALPGDARCRRARQHALESYWSDWPAVYRQQFGQPLPELVLRRGRDFDPVVFGIPAGSLAALCPRLLERSAPLRAAAGRLRTAATQAYQVWLKHGLAQLGWTQQPDGQQPVLTAFSEPYDTWAPMDQLLVREDWPATLAPRSVSYFCSVLPMASYPPQSDRGFPARADALAKQGALRQLDQQIGGLWPAAGRPGAFAWHWRADPQERSGPARFDAQYWRANVDPSERYVLSVAGSAQYRPAADASGLSNLTLAGDWLKTGIDAGCIEAAVMGGMQASRAICGFPEIIEGENDF